MTTVKTVAIHNGVHVTTEVLLYTTNIDNEINHGNTTTCNHFVVMYTTEYDMCCRKQRWHALEFQNGI